MSEKSQEVRVKKGREIFDSNDWFTIGAGAANIGAMLLLFSGTPYPLARALIFAWCAVSCYMLFELGTMRGQVTAMRDHVASLQAMRAEFQLVLDDALKDRAKNAPLEYREAGE